MHSKSLIKWLKGHAPTLFWILIVATMLLLLMEVSPAQNSFPFFDKIVHATIFTLLSGVGYVAYTQYSSLLYCFLAIYGALTEVLQSALTTTRYASLLDWLADLFGILLCFSIVYLVKSTTKTHHGN